MGQVVDIVFKGQDVKITPKGCGNARLGRHSYKTLRARSIRHEIRNGADADTVQFTELFKGRHAGHGAVFVHDFTNHGRRFQPGQTGQIHGAFCLSDPDHDTAIPRSQGEDMARSRQIARFGVIRHCRADGRGTICRRNTCCDPSFGFDGNRKTGLKP